MGRHLIPGRAGVTTEASPNKYRAALHGPRPLRARLRPAGADALADRADLPGARHRQPRPCARTRRSPKCWSTRARSKASGVRVIDSVTQEVLRLQARKVVVLAASTLESTRLLLLRSRATAAQRPREFLGRGRPLLLRAHHGPARQRLPADAARHARATNDDGRPQSTYIVRFRNVSEQAQGLHPRLRLPGRQRQRRVSRRTRTPRRASASAFKKTVRDLHPDADHHRRLRRSAGARRRTRSSLDPAVKDAWGIPVLRFDYKFGDNEQAMAKDMADTAEEMLRGGRRRGHHASRETSDRRLVDPRAGHGADGHRPEDVGDQLRSARPTT